MGKLLKKYMREHGIAVETLAGSLGVKPEVATGWMEHTRKFHPMRYNTLRRFLVAGVDEFAPIEQELRSVQRDEKRYKAGNYQTPGTPAYDWAVHLNNIGGIEA